MSFLGVLYALFSAESKLVITAELYTPRSQTLWRYATRESFLTALNQIILKHSFLVAVLFRQTPRLVGMHGEGEVFGSQWPEVGGGGGGVHRGIPS
jgi:hypothetical protein